MELKEIIRGVEDIVKGYLEITPIVDQPLSRYDGMDSLAALVIMRTVEDTYAIRFRPGDVENFRYMTPHEISDYVHNMREVNM